MFSRRVHNRAAVGRFGPMMLCSPPFWQRKFGQFVLQVVARQAVGQFQQDVPFGIQRFGKAAVRGGKLEGEAADEFEAAQALGEMVFDAGKQQNSSLHIVQPDPCGFGGLRRGEEFERGAGDDAECAFAADEQVFEFVAGSVFV